jgi:hypothetical protein
VKTIFRGFVLLVVLCGWSLAALSLHLVRSTGSFALVTKSELGVWDTYVDVRQWTLSDVTRHPAVAHRLVESGNAELLASVAPRASGIDLEHKINDAIARAPQAQRPSIDVSREAVAAADAAKRAASAAWNELGTR